ncbi:MAG: ATP-binding protein [Desulfosarcina sp.]|nr:ATP-binding protein [Desulfobacterales bacterium]
MEWTLALLPGNEWFIFIPEKLLYISSLQGDEHAGIRFDNQLKPLYIYNIAQYYREELKRSNLRQISTEVNPAINRKWIKKRWDRFENKGLWFSGLAFLCIFTVVIVYLSRRKSDPMEVAKKFFLKAGYKKRESLSQTLFLLHTGDKQKKGLVSFWKESNENLLQSILSHKNKLPADLKTYLIYNKQAPPSENIQKLREDLDYEIIPIFSNIMEKALAKGDCAERLKYLEEPYIVRIDPYLEFNPIHDPTWFFGRDQFLKRLPSVLIQGQNVGIFGLRKVGKTSLINLIRQRFSDTPVVYIDCQGFSEKAAVYFEETLKQLQHELQSFVTAKLPPLAQFFDRESFRRHVLTLFEIWKASGQQSPFLIILDEIDKLFPAEKYADSEKILKEYIHFFRVVRGLAQSHRCLVTMVIAYRPDVNRRNILGERISENPMFRSFQEEYLGFLSAKESNALICEIGVWKKIIWTAKAASKVYNYCGGHPLITRIFASQACQEGVLKSIDLERVEQTASEIKKEMRRNDIGNYYKEGVWDLLNDDEKQVLAICKKGGNGYPETEIPAKLEDALTNLENFGLVTNDSGKLFVTAELFNVWLERRIA